MDIEKLKRTIFKKLTISSTLFILFALSFSFLISSFNSIYRDNGKFLEVTLKDDKPVENRSGILFKDLPKIRERLPRGEMAYTREVETSAQTERGIVPIQTVLTSESLLDFIYFRFVKGGFFPETAEKYGRKTAVISESLAFKLFATRDVIGKEITLFQEQKYEITGIYQQRSTVFSIMGYDGRERVYIPFTSYPEAAAIPLKTLMIRSPGLAEDRFRLHTISNLLVRIGKGGPEAFKLIDHYNTGKLLSQCGGIFNFLIGLTSTVFVWILFWRYAKNVLERFRGDLKMYYLFQTIERQKGRLAVSVVALAGVSILTFLLLHASRFNFYVPPEMVPPDNIFDFGFYFNQIRDAVKAANISHGFIPSRFEMDFRYGLLLDFIISIGCLLSLRYLISSLKLAGQCGVEIQDLLKSLMIAVLCVFAFRFFILLALGVPWAFPYKVFFVCICFISLYDINLFIKCKCVSCIDLQS